MRFRRAVAAAAEERLDEEGWDLRKAWLAADWADWADDEDSGYKNGSVSMLYFAETVR